MTVSPHPLPARLAAFGLGKLDEAQSAPITEHISTCEACRSLVESVADDTLAGLFREAHRRTDLVIPPGEADPADPPSGYELLEVLGEGGMGVVSKARQVRLGRLVALKQIRPEILAGSDGFTRFRREAEAAARLRHPNIVPIYDVGWRNGVPYYSMEYVEGGTLRDRLAAGPLAPLVAARLVEALALAVHHAHQAGVVHRDLKPANILLAPDLDCPKIGDFGLAKQDDDASNTRSGAILGTPGYMSPEQASGDPSKVGPCSDIHALGAIFYETLTGRPPFQAPTVLETLELVRSAEPTLPRQLRTTIPRDLETIILKCLEKDPQRRYPSARALADDLHCHLDGQPITARPVSTPERLAKWARRRPWQAISLALGVILMIGAFAGTLIHNARLRDEVARTDREAKEARTQRTRAEAQYRAARTAIRQMLSRLEDPRFTVSDRLGLRRQLLEDALTFYDGAILDESAADPLTRIDRVQAIMEAGNLQIMIEKTKEAVHSFRRALGLLESLEAEGLIGRESIGRKVDCLTKLGLALAAAGQGDESARVQRQAVELAGQADSHSIHDDNKLAWSHHNLSVILLRLGRHEEAEQHLLKALEVRRAWLSSQPRNDELKGQQAESLINLALIHDHHGQRKQAEVEYDEAAGLLEPIVRKHPEQQPTGLSLAALELNRGMLMLATGRPGQAIERLRAGRAVSDAVLQHIPDWPEARQSASKLAAALAYALGVVDRFGEATTAWDRAISLADGEARKSYRVSRLACLAHQGQTAQALGEAQVMAGESPACSGLDFYNLACVAAIASGSAPSAGDRIFAESAAKCSMGWLEQARTRGTFEDPGMVRALGTHGDPDLKSLWNRDDYRQFSLDLAFPTNPFQQSH